MLVMIIHGSRNEYDSRVFGFSVFFSPAPCRQRPRQLLVIGRRRSRTRTPSPGLRHEVFWITWQVIIRHDCNFVVLFTVSKSLQRIRWPAAATAAMRFSAERYESVRRWRHVEFIAPYSGSSDWRICPTTGLTRGLWDDQGFDFRLVAFVQESSLSKV